jgi:hypothetical protein
VAIAQRVFGARFAELVISMPDDTPAWVSEMLQFFRWHPCCAGPAILAPGRSPAAQPRLPALMRA